jgi:hypothetical protein
VVCFSHQFSSDVQLLNATHATFHLNVSALLKYLITFLSFFRETISSIIIYLTMHDGAWLFICTLNLHSMLPFFLFLLTTSTYEGHLYYVLSSMGCHQQLSN